MPSIYEVLNGHRNRINPNEVSTYQSFVSTSTQNSAFFKSTSLIERFINTQLEPSTSTIKLNVLSSSVSTNFYGTDILTEDRLISRSLILAVIFFLVLLIYLGKIIRKVF